MNDVILLTIRYCSVSIITPFMDSPYHNNDFVEKSSIMFRHNAKQTYIFFCSIQQSEWTNFFFLCML